MPYKTQNLKSPFIIIGMHRSGTSLVTKLLQACGLFIGTELDENNESVFFQKINANTLAAAGADGWTVDLFIEKLRNPFFAFAQTNRMRKELSKGLFSVYFKSDSSFEHAPYSQHHYRWGWKDPRNSFTLPLWLNLFPKAKIIHVVRNGLDVAISLHKRDKSDLNSCFSLWTKYVNQCLSYRNMGEAYHEIYFESLLKNPKGIINETLRFLDCSPLSIDFAVLNSMVDKNITERFKQKSFEAFYKEKYKSSSLLRELGYVPADNAD